MIAFPPSGMMLLEMQIVCVQEKNLARVIFPMGRMIFFEMCSYL
jgi:hypothetical protein